MTAKAIETLSKNGNGYFLMVEGGRIDHALHGTNAKRALEDTIAFDDAIKRALSMVDLSNTLVVVTADHDHTMTINGYSHRGNPIRHGHRHQDQADRAGSGRYALHHLVFGNGGTPRKPTRDNPALVDTTANDYLQEVGVNMGSPGSETHGGGDVMLFSSGPAAPAEGHAGQHQGVRRGQVGPGPLIPSSMPAGRLVPGRACARRPSRRAPFTASPQLHGIDDDEASDPLLARGPARDAGAGRRRRRGGARRPIKPLALRVQHELSSLGSDGVQRDVSFSERVYRTADTVWIERELPHGAHDEAEHAKGDKGHKHMDVSAAARWIERKPDGKLLVRPVSDHQRKTLAVGSAEYGNIGFDGSWATASHLLDPAALKTMKASGPVRDGVQEYRARRGDEQVTVQWDVAGQYPRGADAQCQRHAEEGHARERAGTARTVPWSKAQGYAQGEYADLLD